MLPVLFAINHAQGPKYEKTDVKITVPVRKTAMPIRLNFMNRLAQILALSRFCSLVAGLLIL